MSGLTVAPTLMHSKSDAAAELAVSVTTVERLLRTGALRSVKIGARRLIPHDALTAYVAALTNEDG